MIRLYITNGPMKGQPFDLKGDTTYIGRGPNNDIQINNRSISRKHAKIIRKDDGFFIEDLGSHNGTLVYGELIKPGVQVEVAEGIPVAVGNTFIALSKEAPADGMVTQYLINLSGEKGKTWKNLLYKDRRHTNRKNLELIYEVSNALMQSLDIDEICDKIMDSLFHALSRIDSGVILLINKDTGEFEEIKAKSKNNQKSAEVKYSRTIVNRVIREGKSIMMSDTSSEHYDELSESIEMMKIKSIMCVPLISKSEILGVIYAHSVNVPHGFRKDDLFLFTGLSSPAALAIENALHYSKRKEAELALQRAHDKLEERVRERTVELSKANTLLKQENFERKRAEETLKETNKFLRNILDSSTSFSIISTDLEQNILFWNRGAENIFGYKAEEMVGRQKIDVLYTDETKRIMNGVRASILKNKMGMNTEVIEITKDGYTLWMNLYLSPGFDENGHIVGILGIGVDISESKHLAAQLQQAQKMEAIGTLTGGVAHNFRNILSGILMSSQLIQMKYQDNPSLQEIIAWIISAAEKGSQLVKELMQFSRKQTEKEFRTLNLTEVIQKTYQVICKSFDKKLAIRIDTPEFLFIKGDQSGLSQ
ncbi:MAG: PAS domain S-box protein, partial [Thermodesulfobacteriota bacterium]|nr:PAS domain S-box protein [Thermodesulfobacteriota bacterium]